MELSVKQDQPWEIDTRHLLALAAIARTRSVSRAAEELGYGQSAVSQQLAALERTVGSRLVDRGTGPRPVTLTEAGNALLPHAHWILDRLAAARADVENLAAGESGSIRIGTIQSVGARLLPQILATYRSKWPAIEVNLYNESAEGELSTLVTDGTIDVAFTESGMLGSSLDHVELLVDRFVALVPPSHRLARRTAVSLKDFEGEDMVEAQTGVSCSLRSINSFRDAGVNIKVVFRTDDNPTRQRLVDAGLGCAVLPELTVEALLPNGGVMVPLEERLERRICLTWSRDRTKSKAVAAFIETATETMSSIRS